MFSGFHGTMKFLHGNGYVSENMHPSMIIVLDEDAKHIRIVRIAKMPGCYCTNWFVYRYFALS